MFGAGMAVQVTQEHNEDCKKLLQLMGVPIIVAPSEAEAQCAAMAKAGLVYGAATEDMDYLTFGCPRLIRHLMASQVRLGVPAALIALM
jgi:flap endonuclease-1